MCVCGGGGRGGVEECRVGSGGVGCRREKRGLCGSVCGLYGEIKDVYVSALMKVCFPSVFTSLGPAPYPDSGEESNGEKGGKRSQG